MIPLIISGACGRVGKAIVDCAAAAKDFEIAAALEAPGHPALGRTISQAIGVSGCEIPISSEPPRIEQKAVLVEFSSPEATIGHLKRAVEENWRVVIGTTALNENQLNAVNDAATKIPIVLASNMSLGMNLLFRIVEDAAKILGLDYDAEICETHHRFKKDSPSGSAITLVERIANARGADARNIMTHGRSGIFENRPAGQIGVHSLRAGDIVGEHTVIFAALGERLEFTHRCNNRNAFAMGALRAARFVFDKKPGLYDMQDALGIR